MKILMLRKTSVQKIFLSIVFVLVNCANLFAARYIFYYKDSSGMFHFMAASSTEYPSDVKSSDEPSKRSNYIWYCKKSDNVNASDATISTSSRYFYATSGEKNYWLQHAEGDANQINLTSSAGSGNSYSISNNGYLREGTSEFYVYFQSSDNTWRTSQYSSKYNNLQPSYIEYTGDTLSRTTVKSYPADGGYVYVIGDVTSEHSKYSGKRLTTDMAGRLYPAIYYMHAYPKSGYEFLGWSKTQGGEIVSTNEVYMVSVVNTHETYYANYKALTYTIVFKPSGGCTGTMPDQIVSCGVPTKLNKNNYVLNFTVKYDANGGTVNGGSTWSETISRWTNWRHYNDNGTQTSGDGKKYDPYEDEATVNFSVSGGSTINLYATWYNKRSFTLPSATLGDRALNGWYTGKTSGTRVNVAGQSFEATKDSTLYARWGDPFYAKISLSATTGASGTPSADATTKSSNYKGSNTTNPGKVTFTITAPAASSGYHFTGWTGANVTFANASNLSTTATVKVSNTAGSGNAASYTLTANYEQNLYYANLTATSGGNGSVSVTESPKYTTTSGGDVSFNITATPASGYHFKNWTVTSGTGSFGSTTSASTTFTAKAASNYGASNATAYSVTATFEKDQYNAKLTVANSSISDTSTSTAQVSSDNKNWASNATSGSASANADVTFYVKATPASGYKFVGWSTTNGSSTVVSGLGATGTYTVKSSSTQGGTNAKTLYAIFKKDYTIVINANGTASTDRIIFNVTGPATYRISIPVGGTATLRDVPEGSYTITPEKNWSWDYTVSPATTSVSFNSVNVSTNDFTVTSKNSAKKHDEVTNQKSY